MVSLESEFFNGNGLNEKLSSIQATTVEKSSNIEETPDPKFKSNIQGDILSRISDDPRLIIGVVVMVLIFVFLVKVL